MVCLKCGAKVTVFFLLRKCFFAFFLLPQPIAIFKAEFFSAKYIDCHNSPHQRELP